MTRPLDGQVAIVTGGGKGLGRAFALHLASQGAAVVVNNRNRIVDADGRSAADYVVDEIITAGGRAVANYGDVADAPTADALVKAALDNWGRLDICVTSAAITGAQMFHKLDVDDFTTLIDINVVGTALVASAAMKVMREAGHGRIIMVASTSGVYGFPTVSAYATSKGAVIALGRSIAAEGVGKGVLTNMILPYATTQMTEDGMDAAYADALQPEAVAPIVSALADPSSTINGQVIIAAANGLRVSDPVEYGTVTYDNSGPLTPADLAGLIDKSRAGQPHTYDHAHNAFLDFASELA